MSEVFEGYERQYCEVSANLSKKCTAAGALDGGDSKFPFFLLKILGHIISYGIVLLGLFLYLIRIEDNSSG